MSKSLPAAGRQTSNECQMPKSIKSLKSKNLKDCHAELDSASHKIKDLLDPEIAEPDPEINSG